MEEIAGLSAPVPLTADHDLTQFDCGDATLNDWLRQRALKNESRFSRSYVVCQGARVAGFYCIAAGSVERAATPGKLRRNAPMLCRFRSSGDWLWTASSQERASAPTYFPTLCNGSP